MTRLRTIAIANRGEIAARILRTVQGLGLRGVALYSDADEGALHVAQADEAVRLGPGPAGESYLDGARVIAAAQAAGADAIHPGYGFLSENADFARAVAEAGMVFIGPPAEAIAAMGDKAAARARMAAAGVPCVPGHDGDDQSDAALAEAAARIGYPVMVKAAAGGGGRGMRRVADPADLAAALAEARAEAAGVFGSDRLILERALDGARHVEVQVMADAHGTCLHLGDRDCSIQRRHQKVIEEAPAPGLSPDLRAAMGRAAVEAARAVDYVGAGTVEFLLTQEGHFHFLEMNTRLQVEHPVTEMVTGLDLVALQIAVGEGQALPLTQAEVRCDGHAIEARLCAEKPARAFQPQTGPIALWRPAEGEGVRVDGGVATGNTVSPHYDSLLAKVIAHGPDRETARARLARALAETVLLGLVTNTAFLARIVGSPAFARAELGTDFLDRLGSDEAAAPDDAAVALAAALFLRAEQQAARQRAGWVGAPLLGWSSAPLPPVPLSLSCGDTEWTVAATAQPTVWRVEIDGQVCDVVFEQVESADPDLSGGEFAHPFAAASVTARVGATRLRALLVFPDAGTLDLALGSDRHVFHRRKAGVAAEAAGAGQVTAPMPGLLASLRVAEGDDVAVGEVLAVLEAMKLQHRIVAPCAGRVARVAVTEGAQMAAGETLFEIEEAGE